MAVRHLFPQNTGVWGEEEEEEGKEAGIGYEAP